MSLGLREREMSLGCSERPLGANAVFDEGKHSVQLIKVETESSGSSTSPPPPKPLLIAIPKEEGEYAVVLFIHGFWLSNSYYSQLLHHVASHGFIVVAPQLYQPFSPFLSDEIESAAATTDWLSEGLQPLLPELVRANLLKLALAGHSRGGKTAFTLALGYAKTSLKFSVLMGIDPVAGRSRSNQIPPKILTYKPQSFNLKIPVLVVGAGLGDQKRNCFFPACAPEGVNHAEFFNECRPPTCYLVAKEYGHMDMLDDETSGIMGKMTYASCKNGEGRERMRKFVGGIIVAFLKGYLGGDSGDLRAIMENPEIAPVKLDPVQFLEE